MPARAEKLAKEDAARNPIKDSEEANQRCSELDAELAELRAAYELFFQGLERQPPLKKHDAFKREFAKLKGTFVRQTAAKFRIDTIGQKLMTYERLWERNIKEIENGTFRRELERARRHRKDLDKQKRASTSDADFDVDEDLDLSDLDEGDGDLAAALKAAEAAVQKPPPVSPAIPAVKPAIGITPAIAPVTPPKGVPPGIPGIAPLTPVGTRPATGIQAAFNPLAPPTVTPGAKPTITAALTGAAQAHKPGAPAITAAKPATGVQAALKPPGATGSNPALKPPGSTGSNPALKPPGSTGSNPALRASGSLPPRPAGGSDGGLSDTKIKAIYDAYVMAKKRCGEDTRAVTYDSVATTLKRQVPELMKQHNAKSVEFKVVIKDGKAVLRALPKEE